MYIGDKAKEKTQKNKDFTMIPNIVIRNPKITPYAKAIYIALKSFTPSFPSYRKIMEMTGIGSRTTISSCIKILVACGVIRISSKWSGKSNFYEFPPDLNSPIDGLEFVHDMDTNKTKEIISINNTNGSPAPQEGPVEPEKLSDFFANTARSLGPSAKYGYKQKTSPKFRINQEIKSI